MEMMVSQKEEKTCGCVRNCPCFPECDRLMEEGRIPGARGQGRRQLSAWPEVSSLTAAPMDLLQLQEEDERDWRKLKECYPDMARRLLPEVEAACDRLEYEGSMMFDSLPDKVRVEKLAEEILESLGDPQQEQEELAAMGRGGARPPKKPWQKEMAEVLLFQEMFGRRCRNRSCKKSYR